MEMVSVCEMLMHLNHLMAAVIVGFIEFFCEKNLQDMNFEDTSSSGRIFVSHFSERRYNYNNFGLNNIHLLNLLFSFIPP